MKYKGRFGDYGGFYVPEVLIPALEELEDAFYRFSKDQDFISELEYLYKNYAGRPSPLYYAKRFSEQVGFKVYLKREDLLHGGAHKEKLQDPYQHRSLWNYDFWRSRSQPGPNHIRYQVFSNSLQKV